MNMLHDLDPAVFLENICAVIPIFYGQHAAYFDLLHTIHPGSFGGESLFKRQAAECAAPTQQTDYGSSENTGLDAISAFQPSDEIAMHRDDCRKSLCMIRDAAFVLMDLAFTRGHIGLAQCIRQYLWQPLADLCRPQGG